MSERTIEEVDLFFGALAEATRWGIVEQDMFPTMFDTPLPIARRTRAYLREIGLG